jgi:hypothetical protein
MVKGVQNQRARLRFRGINQWKLPGLQGGIRRSDTDTGM